MRIIFCWAKFLVVEILNECRFPNYETVNNNRENSGIFSSTNFKFACKKEKEER
jgi:hypothetical protein